MGICLRARGALCDGVGGCEWGDVFFYPCCIVANYVRMLESKTVVSEDYSREMRIVLTEKGQ